MSLFNRPVNISGNSEFDALSKASSFIITDVNKQEETKDFKKVKDVVSKLIAAGTSKMGEGYCISVSDIVFNILRHNGIKCHLLEVQLSILDKKTGYTAMVGFHNDKILADHTKVNTHVVVVTETDIPLIIDMSVAHRLPDGMQCILVKADGTEDKVLSEFDFNQCSMIYQQKTDLVENVPFPHIHQISILERMATDKTLFESISHLKKLNYVSIALSIFALLNVIANWINVY